MKTNSKKGFSLVELLVVVTIIAILSVTAYVALGGQTIKAKNSRRIQDLSTIQSAMEIYFVEKGNYPSAASVSGRDAKTFSTATGQLDKKYLPKVAQDPWGVPYAYDVSSTGKEYQLATTIEPENDTSPAKAYVVGNYSGTTGLIIVSSNAVTDGGLTPLPYTKPVTP